MKELTTTVKVDMGDLHSEKENLANYLNSQLKLDSALIREGLQLKIDDATTFTLARTVTKFLYRKNLNSTHWVDVKNTVIKINRFNKQSKEKKNKHPTTASIMKHGF